MIFPDVVVAWATRETNKTFGLLNFFPQDRHKLSGVPANAQYNYRS